MKMSTMLVGAGALFGAMANPARAPAQGGCAYTYSLGLGGAISGCYGATVSELGEDAGGISPQYYWNGNFGGTAGPTNAPIVAGTLMFNNDCGSAGTGTFAFCTGAFAKTPVTITSASGELVFGLQVPDNFYGTGIYWVYSGAAARNAVPAPAGAQNVLLQLTLGGSDDPGQFLLGWEDMNTGCTQRNETNSDRFREEDLGNGPLLNSVLTNCTVIAPGGNSDSDFNDSFMRLNISGSGSILSVTPEPMTMSLMAIGLVGSSVTTLRRRRRR